MLLAPDKFKGCLTATDVCVELRRGLMGGPAQIEVVVRPVADGGDGTLDAALAAGFESRSVAAAGALGEPRSARFGVQGATALIELAEVCGLAQLPEDGLRPMEATSYGVGLAMKAAIGLGYRELVVGLGGSASTDGGIGAATALGARIVDDTGEPVRPGGDGLGELASVDFTPMQDLLAGVRVVLATDVRSPLLGEHGAAAVFAPQKGASGEQVRLLEAGLQRWACAVQAATGLDVRNVPGAGAAGGFAVPFLATGCGSVVAGAQLMLDVTGARAAIEMADLVITGEGRWDSQTSSGKAPHAVVEAARRVGTPVMAVAGSFSADADLTGTAAGYSLAEIAGPDGDPLRDARTLLREIGARIARDLGRAT